MIDAHGLAVGSLASTSTFRSISLLPSPSYCGGTYVRNLLPCLLEPVTSLPMMVTCATSPLSTCSMNLLNGRGVSRVWNVAEKFQIRTPTMTSTIQNSKLLSVEFKPVPPGGVAF